MFVTSVGVVAPHGNTPDEVFERICAGESAVRLVADGTGRIGAPALIAPADPREDEVIPRVKSRLMSRASRMAVVAAQRCFDAAGLEHGDERVCRSGVYIGCGLGGSETLEDHYGRYFAEPPRRIRPATTPLIMASGPASHVSMHLGIRGPAVTYSIACVSSATAIGEAFRAIRDGYVDSVFAGGSEAQLNQGTVAAWNELGVLASVHEDGAGASCRPFDADRTGLVLGEGSTVLLLESEEAALERGATLLGEIAGYGMTSDAHNLTEPTVRGQVGAMKAALSDAGVSAHDVRYVNAHATGTLAGDRVEAEAIVESFGSASQGLAVSSTKSMHGHLVGAAGALEAFLTLRAVATGRVPPTAHIGVPEPECCLDYVAGVGRPVEGLEVGLSNSFAFGGSNAALVLRASRR